MYDIDRHTIQQIGFGNRLMENAGRAVAKKITQKVTADDRLVVLIGPGNNGGDGYVIARTLHNEGYSVQAVQLVSDEKLSEESLFNKRLFANCDGVVSFVNQPAQLEEIIKRADVIIDAIIGMGISGELREPLASFISVINDTSPYTISVDLPSGLPADEGHTQFISIQADDTVIIGAFKMSVFLQHTAPYYGKWDIVSIGYPLHHFPTFTKKRLYTEESFRSSMPQRKTHAYKGTHGRGLAIGGSAQMPGALAMTVKAALRAGAGLMTAGSIPTVIQSLANQCNESMYIPLSEKDGFIMDGDTALSLDEYDAVALGIGMGTQPETGAFIRKMVEQVHHPLIIDADGLNHIRSHLDILKERSYPTIVTPHPGEMAMLLNTSVQDIITAPFHHSLQFATTYETYVVLKGKFTIITTPNGDQVVDTTGNQGLAKGGSGDVLTGVILAMVLQEQSTLDALCNACFIHGKSADLQVALKHSYYDLVASDVIEGIANVYRTFM